MRDLVNKTVLVFGKGVSGSGAKLLLEKEKAKVVLAEDKDFCLLNKQQHFDAIVVSPGVPPSSKIYAFKEARKIPIISEVELAFPFIIDRQIVGITGTNGKTTTTQLIGLMLEKQFKSVSVCGNIGVSLSECVEKGKKDYYAVELSSFQLCQIDDFRPHIAIITNISQDHLDYHKTMESYVAAKLNIAKNQTEEDFLILSADDIPINYLRGFRPKSQVLLTSAFGEVNGAFVKDGYVYFKQEKLFSVDQIKIRGVFNIKNVLSAVAAAKLLNVDNDNIIDVVTSYTVDNHRLKLVATVGKTNYFNDSKGTNIAATIAAANEMVGGTCVILGGKDKQIEYDELFSGFKSNIISAVVLGETSKKMLEAAARVGFSSVFSANSLAEAVIIASFTKAENVLLSPSTSSFDMFKDYAKRGEMFEAIVRQLK